MALVGRRAELAQVADLLDRAQDKSGGVLVVAGLAGSGRTALAEAAVEGGRRRGFEVLRAAAVCGRPGRWVWAQLLRDAGVPDDLVSDLLDEPGPLELDTAAAAFCSDTRRLIVVDDADHGGPEAIKLPVTHYLGLLASQLGQIDDAVDLLEDAAALEREIGALPWLAHTLAALADAHARRAGDGDADRAAECRRSARDIALRLDMPGLLASLSVPADEWMLRRDGSDWLLVAGREHARLRDNRGLHYLRALLAAPGREITSLDLAGGGTGLRSNVGAQPALDVTAQDAYRQRLIWLEAELDDADRVGDSARSGHAEAERQAILGELGRATGLGGRPRRVSAEDERARVNVTRTLRAAIGRITDAAPAAGAHLAASVRTGQFCRYQPAEGGPSRWRV